MSRGELTAKREPSVSVSGARAEAALFGSLGITTGLVYGVGLASGVEEVVLLGVIASDSLEPRN